MTRNGKTYGPIKVIRHDRMERKHCRPVAYWICECTHCGHASSLSDKHLRGFKTGKRKCMRCGAQAAPERSSMIARNKEETCTQNL